MTYRYNSYATKIDWQVNKHVDMSIMIV
jgi:hypothetical protein